MCDFDKSIEAIFIFGLMGIYIVFVIGINWWSVKDAKKQLDRLHGTDT